MVSCVFTGPGNFVVARLSRKAGHFHAWHRETGRAPEVALVRGERGPTAALGHAVHLVHVDA